MTIDKLCVWKEIAIKDAKKDYDIDKIVTFSKDSICCDCDGYDNGCSKYMGVMDERLF